MSIESKNLNEQENVSPFDVEQIEEMNVPNVEFKDHKLSINGVVQEKYEYAGDQRFQKNNPNLLYFQAYVGGREKENHAGYVIDINNPEKELLNVTADKEKNILVNGKKWDSLRGKSVYWDGYNVDVDPEGKKVVFIGIDESDKYSSNREYSVIVNNETWKTKFKSVSCASSVGGVTYAFGGSREENKFAINDKEWIYNRFKNEKYHGGGLDEISNVKISEKGEVVAVIDSLRQNDDNRRYISIGDKVGEKFVWKNTFAPASYEKPNVIAIGNESGNVAVFGQTERDGKTGLLINDIPYEISGNPEKLEYMDFKDGGLVIQYNNALGEKVTEKISLREDSKAFQEMKEKKEAEEKAFENLRRLLVAENIPTNEIVTRLKKGEALDKEVEKNNEKNKNLNSRISSLEEEKIKLQSKIEQEKKEHEQEMRNAETRSANAEITLKKLENILKGAGKVTMSSNFKLSPEDMKLALDSIQNILEKNK